MWHVCLNHGKYFQGFHMNYWNSVHDSPTWLPAFCIGIPIWRLEETTTSASLFDNSQISPAMYDGTLALQPPRTFFNHRAKLFPGSSDCNPISCFPRSAHTGYKNVPFYLQVYPEKYCVISFAETLIMVMHSWWWELCLAPSVLHSGWILCICWYAKMIMWYTIFKSHNVCMLHHCSHDMIETVYVNVFSPLRQPFMLMHAGYGNT